jgi:hypothetical protein
MNLKTRFLWTGSFSLTRQNRFATIRHMLCLLSKHERSPVSFGCKDRVIYFEACWYSDAKGNTLGCPCSENAPSGSSWVKCESSDQSRARAGSARSRTWRHFGRLFESQGKPAWTLAAAHREHRLEYRC